MINDDSAMTLISHQKSSGDRSSNHSAQIEIGVERFGTFLPDISTAPWKIFLLLIRAFILPESGQDLPQLRTM